MKTIERVLLLFLFSHNLIYPQEIKLYNETNSPLIPFDLYSLAIDSSNAIWIGGSNEIIKFDGRWENIEDLWALNEKYYIEDIQIAPNGKIWAALYDINYNHNLISYNGEDLNYYSYLGLYFPRNIHIANDTTLYLTLINYWPHQLHSDAIGMFSEDSIITINYPCLNSVVSYYEDTLLVASCAFGITKLIEDSIIVSNPEGWEPYEITKINDEIFVYSERLSKYENGKYIEYPKIDSILSSDTSNISSLANEGKDILWIGTDKGKLIKYSEDIEVFELSDYAIRDINIDRFNNKWFISYDGCFEFNENKIVGVKNENKLPSQYSLQQNYPNPFNPLTKIKFSLPIGNYTKIIIYDNLGREITKLVNEYKNTGIYEVEFNSENLSSGIYYYKIISGKYSETKKMILLK